MTEAILAVDNLRKIYPNGSGIEDVSLEVRGNGIHALLGQNGAGKSTTILCILGILNRQSGTVRISGDEYRSNDHRIRERIGFAPELPALPAYLNAKECLISYGLMRGMSMNEVKAQVDDLLGKVDLPDTGEKKIGGFSRGMLAKLDLAISMLGDPEILILDEPTAGLDPISKRSFMGTLKDVGYGTQAVLMSSHQLSDVQKFCTSATIIHHGKTIMQSGIDRILEEAGELNDYLIEFIGNNDRLLHELRRTDGIISATEEANGKIRISLEKTSVATDVLQDVAGKAGGHIVGLTQQEADLEDAFVRIIEKNARGGI